jgi:hypothetical protein
MSKLYFGVVPYGTLADVFITSLVNWSDNWLPTCIPDITNHGHLIFDKHEEYVTELSKGEPMAFRDQDYTDRLDEIENVVEQAGDKKVWIGSFHSKQARIIKKHFGDDVTTVGISYKPQTRYIVLENVVSYYGVSDIENTQEQKIAFNAKYYSDRDKWDKQVPISFDPDTDVSVPLESFFEPDNFISSLEQIDGPRNEKQLEYYFTWLYRTKERLNEGY